MTKLDKEGVCMFTGFTNETYEFFMAIRFNNNREFFQENKLWYARAVREPMCALAQALSPLMESIDPDMELRPGRCISRVNRDVRFARDKSPYKDYTFMKFRVPCEDEAGTPGFFFDMSDNGASCGMGMYNRNAPLMRALRCQLATVPEPFLDAIAPLAAFTLFDDPIRRMKVPESIPEPAKVWYPLRGFYLQREIHDFDLLKSPALVERLTADFQALTPLYQYLMQLTPLDDN